MMTKGLKKGQVANSGVDIKGYFEENSSRPNSERKEESFSTKFWGLN